MIFKRGILNAYSTEVLFLFRLCDAIGVVIAGLLSYYLVSETLMPEARERSYLLVLGVFSFALAGEWVGLYRSHRTKIFVKEAARVAVAGFAALATVFAAHGIAPWYDEVAINISIYWWVVYWFVSLLLTMLLFRSVLRLLLQWLRSKGFNLRHVVIVGTNDMLQDVADALKHHPEFGIRVDGLFDDRVTERQQVTGNYQRLGTVGDLRTYIADNGVDQIWIAYPVTAQSRCWEVLEVLRDFTVDIRFLMHTNHITGGYSSFTDFAGLPLLDIEVTPMEGLGYYYKLIEDKVMALLVLVLLSPLFVAIAIGVKLSSPGPIFYRQERISWNNRPFMMLKFRSMPVGVEKDTGPAWASQGESRATKFGALLRKTSLDELPQFINVLKGDMSVVGPRPERPFFVEQFKSQIPFYMKKHMVKAGITGWAQINGFRGETDLEQRIQHDLFYIRNWSLAFDLVIIIKTCWSGFVNENAY